MIDAWVVNLLLPGGSIKPVELDQVSEIRLDDAKLQQELVKALSAVAAARDQDSKPVAIRFSGQGERRVRIGYVVEAPVWKASYRLVLNEDAKNETAGGAPTRGRPGHERRGRDKKTRWIMRTRTAKGGSLQGWAIVENQTDSDWENVQLSLVSGRPISFIEDLYQPLFVARPVVEPELYASLRPQQYARGMNRNRTAKGIAADRRRKRMPMAERPRGPGMQLAGGRGASPSDAQKRQREAMQRNF